ncbi:hypothetical protein HanIR_Chr03g0147981 [Helianthus annuus]|nr:hypothetical protein HanIR_Chr03g0147981 [Helianthus annuus]
MFHEVSGLLICIMERAVPMSVGFNALKTFGSWNWVGVGGCWVNGCIWACWYARWAWLYWGWG